MLRCDKETAQPTLHLVDVRLTCLINITYLLIKPVMNTVHISLGLLCLIDLNLLSSALFIKHVQLVGLLL